MSQTQKTRNSQIPVHDGPTVLDFSSDIDAETSIDRGAVSGHVPNGIVYGNSFMNETLQQRLLAYSQQRNTQSANDQSGEHHPIGDDRLTQAYLDMQTLKVNQAIDDGIDESKDPDSDKLDEWSELRELRSDVLSKEQQALLDERFAKLFPDVPPVNNEVKVQMLWSERLSRKLTDEEKELLATVADAQNLEEQDFTFIIEQIEQNNVAVVFENYRIDRTQAFDILNGGKADEGGLLDHREAKSKQQPDAS